MCGIAGVYAWRPGIRLDEPVLMAMREAITSRGPDDAGLLVRHGRRVRLGLAHRRLSILDLTPRGRQPMATGDGRLTIVFNGEIFNYRELRRALQESHGCDFHSDTDTEVVLQGLARWGLEAALRRFRGMYAFALFDRDDETLTLVRDPLGVKPLYYRAGPGDIMFASEIKALLAHPECGRAIDARALSHYLTFANSPAPHTLFAGVRKLEAGCYLRVDAAGACHNQRYWDPGVIAPERSMSEADYVERLRALLRQAVARRMVADVPFGVFLSGGVDSALNVALMCEQMSRPVSTFSVGISGDPANEFAHARAVARSFGAQHREIEIGHRDFLAFLERMAYVQDEPLADPVCVPLFYLAKLARESGTPVVQVGEGSDELFGGYGMYHRFNAWNRYAYRPLAQLPRAARRALYRLAGSFGNAALSDAGRRALDGHPLFLGNAIAFWDCEKQGLLKEPPPSEWYASRLIHELEQTSRAEDSLLRMINVELRNRLPELLLMRVDKVTMANSIEARVPFLDEDVVEFALRLPSSLKFKNGIAKYILKKAAEGLLSPQVIYRKKWGFCGSATTIVTPELAAHAREVVLASPLIGALLHRPRVEELFRQHGLQPRFNSFKIWNLLNLALWHATWFESTPRRVAA
jgi:asparagine synthase (glutamine-hydrolysing)